MAYRNGHVPYDVVSVVLGSGTDSNGYWEFRCTPSFAARWAFAKKEALRRFGRTIHIRTGWNIYRPIASQWVAYNNAKAAGNPKGAAYPGSSSHGGEWGGRVCLAVDVDPNGLSWDQVDVAMEAAGFSARLITEAMSGIKGGERWHYIDFNAFGPIPAGMGATTFKPEEDDMPGIAEIFHTPIVKSPDGPDMTLAQFMTNVSRWAAEATWRQGLPHPLIEGADGRPLMVAAGDFLRLEAAEHANTRAAVALVASGDIDYDRITADLRKAYPQIDVHALAVAAADEADRRERERLDEKFTS